MLKKALNFVRSPLILGSSIIFISSIAANFFHFLFNLFMSRTLSIPDYGTVAALSSLIGLTGIISSALIPTIVKFAATHFANSEHEKAKALFVKTTQFILILGGLLFICFVLFQNNIASFFHILGDKQLIILSGLVAIASFLYTTNNAFLQAKLAFGYLSFVSFLSAFIRFSLGTVLIIVGYKVAGALWALFFSSVIPYIISFFPLRFVFYKYANTSNISIKQLIRYGGPAALCTFSLTSLTSIDVILVKHFFTPQEAGLYAGLTLIGKVIFFFSLPITTAMFPLVVQRFTKKESYNGIFLLSVALLLLSCLSITIFYYLFPQFVISFFLKREAYFAVASLLGIMGLFISLFSLLSLVVNFFLSIHKVQIFIPLSLGALAQFLGIWYFHASFMQVILISLSVVSLLLCILLLYYVRIRQ